jgi:hypothetical protein
MRGRTALQSTAYGTVLSGYFFPRSFDSAMHPRLFALLHIETLKGNSRCYSHDLPDKIVCRSTLLP